ncbi:hypothetical protein FCU45_07910 [Sulfurimonas crateris]|uniref:Uncharacterized protein n=1 Tax=Sulfurimonas crateris TaxID=2574727 RepID=A0A4U2Z610_9BACT|nr:hypothetical protein [Sulfurimonas crateris]TKI68880.1 hypothetical protein FCU45_07910 [Sulfurimonas crateris]
MQTQNKFIDSNSIQNQNLSHVDNFRKYGAVTSLLNNSKKSLNNKNTQINAFALMSNKSLRNRYALTGL